MPNLSSLGGLEVTCPGWLGGWPETDNKAISVQSNLTETGTELGNRQKEPLIGAGAFAISKKEIVLFLMYGVV